MAYGVISFPPDRDSKKAKARGKL